PYLLVLHLYQCRHLRDRKPVPLHSYTVWAATVPGGGQQLNGGQSWTINVNAGTKQAPGQGRCETGDCNGQLQCRGFGQPPNTLAEYALNQFNNIDFFDISLVDGLNVPMDFSPVSGDCRGIRCAADINGQCPNQLRAPGMMNHQIRGRILSSMERMTHISLRQKGNKIGENVNSKPYRLRLLGNIRTADILN
ncbi:hypothetical protein Dsin_008407, partial [Dipteronia sinensis]